MKRHFLVSGLLMVSLLSYGQKKELKEAEKMLEKGEAAAALNQLDAISGTIASSEAKYQEQYYFLKGSALNNLSRYEESLESFSKMQMTGSSTYKAESDKIKQDMAVSLVNSAVEDNSAKNYTSASKKLYLAYTITDNKDYLYFSAGSAVNAGDYDTALAYYEDLKKMGYTGESVEYWATDKSTGEKQNFGQDKLQRDLVVKSKEYINPEDIKSESRLPEIVKNIGLIYTQKGETDKAIAAIKEARKSNPDDLGLLLTEADLYIKMGDNERFKSLMEEAVKRDPTNPNLFFNLGVISSQQGDKEKAAEYYQTAINLKPDYVDAYMNLAYNILDREPAIVDEMNSLGNTKADNLRYDQLKQERENLYRQSVPYLKKVLEYRPDDLAAAKTLMNIYGTLGENESFLEMKKKVEELEN